MISRSVHTAGSLDRVDVGGDFARIDKGIDATDASNAVTFETPVSLPIACKEKHENRDSTEAYEELLERCHCDRETYTSLGR